jgi:plasmid stabilization system protein ParE
LRVIWSPEAADDLEAAIEYLAARNGHAAARLAHGILALVEQLAEAPLEGPEHTLTTGEKVRGWPYPPFRVYYQRGEEAFLVLRIYHQRREPIVR